MVNKLKFRSAILKLIKKDYSDFNEQKLITRLNQASEIELERMYDAINRFGAKMIFDIIENKGKCLGYTNKKCIKCGRLRVEQYENGNKICEKCNWNETTEEYEERDY
jgi:ribosomal protein L37AE/L43A